MYKSEAKTYVKYKYENLFFLYIHTKKIMAYAVRKLLITFISLLRTAKLAPLKKQLINIFSFLSTGYCDKWLYYAIFVILTGATLALRLELVPKWYARTHFYIRRHSYALRARSVSGSLFATLALRFQQKKPVRNACRPRVFSIYQKILRTARIL